MAQAYLVLYNSAQLVGWSAALFKTAESLHPGSHSPTYQAAAQIVRLCQGLAILETVHATIGLVKGSPATAMLQWFGRANVLFALLGYLPEVQHGWAVPALFAAWALSEVIRYPWYIAAQFREPPALLTWLRYSMFIPLYPLGIVSEVAIIYNSLSILKRSNLHSLSLPNRLNFSFSYYHFCLFGLFVLYPVAFPWLFTTLLRQRRRKLSSVKKTQ